MVLIRVDLPQPFGPRTATCSSESMRRVKSSRTILPSLNVPFSHVRFPRITRMFRRSSRGGCFCTGRWIVAFSPLEYRNSYAMGRHAASWNSSEFHEIAIFPQPRTANLMTVTLLTGRVYGDGLGGLRAVLFIFGQPSSTHFCILNP